ncbi:MAG: FAD-binding protein, partial [Planctomycetota bacterium]
YDDTALLTQSQFSDQTRTYHLPLDQLRKALRAAFRNDPQVDVRPHTRAITLLRNAAGRCIGALLLSRDGRIIEMLARVTLLATGGAAGLFAHSLAHPDLLGDGWTLAADAGAQLANLEFVSYVLAGRRSGHQLEVVPVERFRRDSLHPLITDAAGNDIIEAALPDLVDRAKAFRRRSEMPAFTIGSIAQRIDLAILQANRRHDDPARPGVPSVKVSLDGGPLYTEVAHHAWSTAGGVVVNRHGFTGVPGLFAAGEVTTGMLGAQPPGGTDAAVALVFGALAGAAMAAEVAGVHHDGGRIDDVPVYDGLQVFDDPAAPMADREVVKAMRLFAASTLPIKPHEALRGQFVLRRDAWRATLPSLGEALANPDGESRWAALDIHFAFATLQRMVRATLARTTSLGPVLMDDALDTDGITLTAEQVFDNTERQVVTIDDDEAAKWSGGDDDGAGSSGE